MVRLLQIATACCHPFSKHHSINKQCAQDLELEQALAENEASLQEISQLRTLDPDSAELLQLEGELSDAVRTLQESLKAPELKNAPNPSHKASPGGAEGMPLAVASTSEDPESGRPTKRQRMQQQQQQRTMHPSNQYASEEPDFAALAQEYPELQPFIRIQRKGQVSLAFDNPDANR